MARDDPRSPCIDVCQIGGDGLCLGCLRTLDEIAAWGGATAAMRRAILRDVTIRRRARER